MSERPAAPVEHDARISVIVPALNEAGTLPALLDDLQPLRRVGHEVIVVDGGSDDGTVTIAEPWADRVLQAPRGRARQMNAGAAVARGTVLWFLHADTRVPAGAADALLRPLDRDGAQWGRFDVRLDSGHPLLHLVAWSMNHRSRLTGIATGDQGIFVTRAVFEAESGYADQPIMEDIELSRRLKQRGRPACVGLRLTTASRRWRRRGILRTVALMWRLRLAYFLGAAPKALARRYEADSS